MQPAEQTANKNKIMWRSHVKKMAPTAPPSKALMIHPVGKRPRGTPRNRWEDNVPKWYKEMRIPMTDVNNWVNDIRPIDADGRIVRLNISNYVLLAGLPGFARDSCSKIISISAFYF